MTAQSRGTQARALLLINKIPWAPLTCSREKLCDARVAVISTVPDATSRLCIDRKNTSPDSGKPAEQETFRSCHQPPPPTHHTRSWTSAEAPANVHR